MVVASIGQTMKAGFLMKQGRKGKFLHGIIQQYGNRRGIAQKAIRGKV